MHKKFCMKKCAPFLLNQLDSKKTLVRFNLDNWVVLNHFCFFEGWIIYLWQGYQAAYLAQTNRLATPANLILKGVKIYGGKTF